ncbi:MAG: hypothetical protein NXH70_03515 [Hyphomonas sp.]|nr:hypothetical protein [Hyphomonas sp.]
MTDLQTELTGWCQSYVDAFNEGDADAIAAHWTFPALTTQAERSYTFKSAEHFAKNTGILLGFYEAQGVQCVVRQLEACHVLHDGVASMTVSDVMYDADGAEIAGWQAAYVLQRVSGAWRAVMAVADGETDAWTARGTPLGG